MSEIFQVFILDISGKLDCFFGYMEEKDMKCCISLGEHFEMNGRELFCYFLEIGLK